MTDGRHRLAEERSLALHALVAERLRAEPSVLQQARLRVQGWLGEGPQARPLAEAWRAVLDLPLDEIVAALADPSERAGQLRRSSPFAGAIDARSRWAVWRRVGERHGIR